MSAVMFDIGVGIFMLVEPFISSLAVFDTGLCFKVRQLSSLQFLPTASL